MKYVSTFVFREDKIIISKKYIEIKKDEESHSLKVN